jgi:hypothetical protein
VLGYVAAAQQWHAGLEHATGEVLGQLSPYAGVGDDPGGRDVTLDLATHVGGVPPGPASPQRRSSVERPR